MLFEGCPDHMKIYCRKLDLLGPNLAKIFLCVFLAKSVPCGYTGVGLHTWQELGTGYSVRLLLLERMGLEFLGVPLLA